jgi:hypothetical protein
MEFKGTKGKWEINPKASRNVRCNNLTIANCSSGQNGENEIEEKANALLISKAPEMLNMLKTTSNCLWMLNTKGTNELAEEIDKLIEEATEI